MSIEARINGHFTSSIAALEASRVLAPALLTTAERLAAALKAGNKVLACGNGGSAADAQHFAAELVGRFERERPGLPGISLTTDTSGLTAIGNDYGFDHIFSKQVQALARPGDWLLAISTSGNSPNVLRAVHAMHEVGGHVLAMTGRDGGSIARALKPSDLELRAVTPVTARVQEVHIVLLHCICDGIDELLFPAG